MSVWEPPIAARPGLERKCSGCERFAFPDYGHNRKPVAQRLEGEIPLQPEIFLRAVLNDAYSAKLLLFACSCASSDSGVAALETGEGHMQRFDPKPPLQSRFRCSFCC